MQKQDRFGEIETLSHFRLIKRLGKGGFAEVYLAEHTLISERHVAIKILKSRELQGYEQDQFRLEAKMLMSLSHPHIINVTDYGIEENKRGDASIPYLVMEYAPLGSLRHLHRHGSQVPLPKVVLYTNQVADALQYAHDHSPVIVHRDIKPENMLVRNSDDVALSDFGIAVEGLATGNLQLQIEQIMDKINRRENVQVPGTAPYIAPERLEGRTQRASDQYSLAVVVYEWLCGRRPFEGNDIEICKKHLSEPPPPLNRNYPHISPAIEQVVMKGLEKDPDRRYRTVKEFAQALENAARSAMPQRVVPAPKPSSPPSPTPLPPTISPVGGGGQQGQQLHAPLPMPAPIEKPKVTPQAADVNNGARSRSQQPDFNNRAQQYQQPNPPSFGGQQYQQPNPPSFGGQQYQQSNFNVGGGQQYQQPNSFGNMGQQYQQSNFNVGGGQQYQQSNLVGGGGINDDPTVLAPPPNTPPLDSLSEFMESVNTVLKTDPHFLKVYKMRWFLPLVALVNILLAVGMLIVNFGGNLLLAVLGGALSIYMLYRCVITVKRLVAILFGVVVAFWWGFAAATIASKFSTDVAVACFVLAFAAGLGLHVWYVNNRLNE